MKELVMVRIGNDLSAVWRFWRLQYKHGYYNSDIEPTIIFRQNAINMVFIGHDNNKYYLLNGQPNSVMQEKIEAAKKSIISREIREMKNIFHPEMYHLFF